MRTPGEPTERQQALANAVVALNVSFNTAAVEAARQLAPMSEAFNQSVANFAEAVRRAQQNRGMTR
jgi:predicted outer membrane protein